LKKTKKGVKPVKKALPKKKKVNKTKKDDVQLADGSRVNINITVSPAVPVVKKPLDIFFLLDETGSMSDIKEKTIEGYNSYIETMREKARDQGITFTLVKFNTGKFEKVYTSKPLESLRRLGWNDYLPDNGTPLIDASYQIIRLAEEVKRKDADVVVVIQTDGQENASRQYTRQQLSDLISQKKENHWEFLFIGANIDAFSAARDYGISLTKTMSYGKGSTAQMFTGLATNMVNYASSLNASGVRGSSNMGWNEDQRIKAGDVHFKNYKEQIEKDKEEEASSTDTK
jgi:hypothetical protein